jgi:hypothetical protein
LGGDVDRLLATAPPVPEHFVDMALSLAKGRSPETKAFLIEHLAPRLHAGAAAEPAWAPLLKRAGVFGEGVAECSALLAAGCVAEVRRAFGSPLHVAVFGPVGHFEGLLKQGIDVDEKNLLGESPLCASVCAGRVDIVEAQVRAGAGPEAGLLREAVEGGDIGIVEALMRGGAVIQNGVQDAAYARHWRLAEHLLGRGASPTALGLAARAGELGLVRQMIAAKPALAALDGALREAVSGGDVTLVEVLLRAGARPNETGYPPVLA